MKTPINSSVGTSRRHFLKRGAQTIGGIAVVAMAGGVWRATEEDIFSPFDGPAYEPWSTWKTEPLAGPMALVQSAILAANPHNTQPWRFSVKPDRIDVFADSSRHLGAFDPYRREMQIGLGCAIENIVLSAPVHGMNAFVEAQPGRLPDKPQTSGFDLIATVKLSPGEKRTSELFDAIPLRHTDRFPYQRTKAVPKQLVQSLADIAAAEGLRLDIFDNKKTRLNFDALMMDATTAIVADHEMVMASHRWFRTTDAAIQTYRDGPNLDTAGLSPMMTMAAKIFPDPSPEAGHKMWLNATRDSHLATAPATALLSVRDRYGRIDNLQAGRAWQRMHLFATTKNLSMHPMNQPIEWADRQRQLGQKPSADQRLNDLVGESGWQPTFAFRMGYNEGQTPPSPRRPASDCLV